MSGFENLLEKMVPGASRQASTAPDEPRFPAELGLTDPELLARGGSGWVFRARDPLLERNVAIKIGRADVPESRSTLLKEAQLTARLKHPAVLPVHRIIVAGGQLCVEYALAPERTMEVLLEDPDALRRSPVERRLAMVRAIVDALARAHDLGIVHGDIHPGNVGVGPSWEPYLLDWSGERSGPTGTFTGDPAYAAPELLHGQPPSPAADVYALGVLLWELFSGRRLRPRRRGEDLGSFVALRWHEQGIRLDEELRVVLVQRQKIPGHAALSHKRPLWEAEDRVAELTDERHLGWLRATRQASLAAPLLPESQESQSTLGDLWWERMLHAESRGDLREAWIARRQVLRSDPERKGRTLLTPAHVTLTAGVGAQVDIARFVEKSRRLVPERIAQHALPLERLALPTGSYLITATTTDGAITRYPLSLGRLEHHQNRLQFYSRAQIGEDWVYMPSGPFRLGGDATAPRSVEPCRPTIGDRFIMRSQVTCQQWCAFLDALPLEEATTRAPGRSGRFGAVESSWQRTEQGWQIPESWDPMWPIIGVSHFDALAYALWVTEQTGRRVRLPTEEEWEKAARGVDGRAWPWGNHFDPCFANMSRSIPDQHGPVPVGRFGDDTSVYGCLDMAGNVAEWTLSMMDTRLIAVRSGSWRAEPDELRCASRRAVPPQYRASIISFRLISEQPID